MFICILEFSKKDNQGANGRFCPVEWVMATRLGNDNTANILCRLKSNK
jgi:hypothetical protein